MPRNLVLFDLEWNIGYQPYTFNYHGVQQTFRGEIVEIGAVKIDEDANVLDTFSIHLRPRIFRKLQHHIAKVTGLTQADLDKGEPIVQGLRRFMQWCGPDAEFAEWGMDDVPVLKQNLFLCNLDESRPTQWYDLQQVFLREHPRKEGEGMTLESVVTRMGIPMERQFHDALSDTLYTADVCRLLDLRAGLAAYPTEDESLHDDLPGVRHRPDPGRCLAEKGQQQLVHPEPVPALCRFRQCRERRRVPALQAGPPRRAALELCPLPAAAG